MYLSTLRVQSFRNFRDETFEFGPSFNILVGDNAQGKTNVLEAVDFLSRGRSFRTTEWRDLIEHGRGRALIEARLVRPEGEDLLRGVLAEPRKRLERNGKGAAPGGFKEVRTVLFAPEEILLLRTQPAARRRFIDDFVSAFITSHKKKVRDYETVMSQRNRILQDEELSDSEKAKRLEPWDDQLVSLGTEIMHTRLDWSDRLNESLPHHYNTIASDDGRAEFRYQPHTEINSFWDSLRARRDDELARRVTLVGPHRDDLTAMIGRDVVKRFASQGQHRSFVLALKVAELSVHREVYSVQPVLLLDDIASELDPERNRRFFEYIQQAEGQVFITTTRREDVKLKRNKKTVLYNIRSGKAKRVTTA